MGSLGLCTARHDIWRNLDERAVLALAIKILGTSATFSILVVMVWIWLAATGARQELLMLREKGEANGSSLLLNDGGSGENTVRSWAAVCSWWIFSGLTKEDDAQLFLVLEATAATYVVSKVLIVLVATRPDERVGSLVKLFEWLLLGVGPALWLLARMWRPAYGVVLFVACCAVGMLFLALLIVRGSIHRVRSARREGQWLKHHLYGGEPPNEEAEG